MKTLNESAVLIGGVSAIGHLVLCALSLVHAETEYIVLLVMVQNVVMIQEEEVASSLLETERSMRKMVSNQIALQKQLIGQTKGLKSLLVKRGIGVRTVAQTPNKSSQEEKDTHSTEEVMDTSKAASAVMAAAAAALQAPPKTTAV